MRQVYTHRAGQVYDTGRLISPAEAKAMLDAHRQGAKASGSFGARAAAQVSADLAEQLDAAMKAAAIFNAHLTTKPSPEERAAGEGMAR